MAGDVAKIQDRARPVYAMARVSAGMGGGIGQAPQVTQQAFDDFHLYDLNRNVNLRSGETKQVQFMQASDVTMKRVYEYDGSGLSNTVYGNQTDTAWAMGNSNKKVGVRVEIKNAQANHMGMPLPAGRVRVYRRDEAGGMEFVGESMIDHTPAEETLKLAIGSAFDVTGERKQTDFHVDTRGHSMDESFEITLKNQKTTPATVAVVEHLSRSRNWQMMQKSDEYTKRDSNTIEFPAVVPAHGQKTISYTVHYSW